MTLQGLLHRITTTSKRVFGWGPDSNPHASFLLARGIGKKWEGDGKRRIGGNKRGIYRVLIKERGWRYGEEMWVVGELGRVKRDRDFEENE